MVNPGRWKDIEYQGGRGMNWKQIETLADKSTVWRFHWGLYDTEIEGCHLLTDQNSALLIYSKLPPELEKHVITDKSWSKKSNNLLKKDYHEFAPVHLASLQQVLGEPIWGHTKESCSDCNGAGVVKCDDCSGTGFVDCDCDCPYCDNEIECPECDGAGKLECCHQATLDYNSLVMFRSSNRSKTLGGYFSKLRVAQVLGLVTGVDRYVKISLSAKGHPMLIEGEFWKLVIMPVRIDPAPESVPVVELTGKEDSLYGFTKEVLGSEQSD